MAQKYPYPADRFSLVGRVTRSHGIKGELKVLPLQGPDDDFKRYSRVALVAADGRMTEVLDIVRSRVHGRQVILKLDTIDTKNEADLTAEMGVLCLRGEMLPNTGESDDPEMIGVEVATADGTVIGTVGSVSHTGAHPLMVVQGDCDEYLIPLVEEIVVERTDRKIIIDPPDGLLEINRKG